ncbi:LacI family DNA-binding transcriptional regulator [Alteromonas aestuariivivens]|uniref:LacI family DNA-binding transcriptional regulator n=1 Tax=Alteromonas aestuariivivens TaxID=1938339 RepID=A0A3D8MCU1_9ALTE|nr:LacI family DNA-binding transcriptional regulator [Alteromonas aestuariivivens]RDV27993.1 LacI family DNA-binding transcriptional regulator [Alteromonas aestuariivivens]
MKTIKDVARLAGVSPATVSRFLNSSDMVNAQTRQRIQSAIEELDYRPNASARALVTKSTQTIGVVISELADPFFAKMAHSIEQTAKKLNRKVLISTGSLNADKEFKAVQSLVAQRCDAIVVNSKAMSDEVLVDLAKNIPGFVLINKYIEAIRHRCVWFDNVKGGQLMAEHALQRGHRDIVVVTTSEKVHDASRRLKGIRSALSHAGVRLPMSQVLHVSPDYAGGQQAIKLLQQQGAAFSMLLCYNDAMAAGAIAELLDAGYKIPQDVSIIGFDDVLLAQYCVPKLTTIKYPIEVMAAKATELALQLSQNQQMQGEGYCYSPFLVNRESVYTR